MTIEVVFEFEWARSTDTFHDVDHVDALSNGYLNVYVVGQLMAVATYAPGKWIRYRSSNEGAHK